MSAVGIYTLADRETFERMKRAGASYRVIGEALDRTKNAIAGWHGRGLPVVDEPVKPPNREARLAKARYPGGVNLRGEADHARRIRAATIMLGQRIAALQERRP